MTIKTPGYRIKNVDTYPCNSCKSMPVDVVVLHTSRIVTALGSWHTFGKSICYLITLWQIRTANYAKQDHQVSINWKQIKVHLPYFDDRTTLRVRCSLKQSKKRVISLGGYITIRRKIFSPQMCFDPVSLRLSLASLSHFFVLLLHHWIRYGHNKSQLNGFIV